MATFDVLVAEAERQAFSGWDFHWVHGRIVQGPLPFSGAEIARVLRPGGTFLTQQVGGSNLSGLNTLLGAPPYAHAAWTLEVAVRQLQTAGLRLLRAEESFPPVTFNDVGAVVFQLRAVAWQISGFTVAAYRDALRRLDERMPVTVTGHRFLVEAVKRSPG